MFLSAQFLCLSSRPSGVPFRGSSIAERSQVWAILKTINQMNQWPKQRKQTITFTKLQGGERTCNGSRVKKGSGRQRVIIRMKMGSAIQPFSPSIMYHGFSRSQGAGASQLQFCLSLRPLS